MPSTLEIDETFPRLLAKLIGACGMPIRMFSTDDYDDQ